MSRLARLKRARRTLRWLTLRELGVPARGPRNMVAVPRAAVAAEVRKVVAARGPLL